MTPDREKLRQLAERATKGPWMLEANLLDITAQLEDRAVIDIAHTNPHREIRPIDAQSNAHFIVAAQPAAVLSLLDEIERVEAENKMRKLVSEINDKALKQSFATIASLKADLAEAREALEPFAGHAAFFNECEQHPGGCPDESQSGELPDLTVGDFLRAASVHSRLSGEGE